MNRAAMADAVPGSSEGTVGCYAAQHRSCDSRSGFGLNELSDPSLALSLWNGAMEHGPRPGPVPLHQNAGETVRGFNDLTFVTGDRHSAVDEDPSSRAV